MTPAQLIAQAILTELRRQRDAEPTTMAATSWIDDEMGADSVTIDGTFDFDAIGAAILAHPPCQLLHVRYSDDGQHLRKWSREPFAEGAPVLAIDADARTPANPEARYLIRKSGAYYRPNAQGYTHHRAAAGRYTLAEAISHSHPNGPDGPRDGITYALDDGTEGEWL